jgi:type II secretory pathway pseudopilin PulG
MRTHGIQGDRWESGPRDARENAKAAFSLMEIVLALLVFALGVMATVSLFPAALRFNRDATDATRTAQFAQRVFNGVFAETVANTNRWEELLSWADWYSTNKVQDEQREVAVSLPPAENESVAFWQENSNLTVYVSEDWKTHSFRYADNTNLVDFVMRYRLRAYAESVSRYLHRHTIVNQLVTNAITGKVDTNRISRWFVEKPKYDNFEKRYRTRILRLALEVKPGEIGDATKSYYTHLPRLF